ncbi:MAG: porin family protein [Prevotella sp.]|nr:porin family protein [Prevotella sp.]
MRRYFLFIALLFGCMISMSAQQRTRGFEPQIKVGFDLGVDGFKNNSAGLELLAGYRFNEYTRIGLGTGVSYNYLVYEQNMFGDDYKESAMQIPVFVNGKFNFISHGISPYFGIDLGYAFFFACSDYAKENDLGFYFKPALGVDFPLDIGTLFLEFGYKYQTRDWFEDNSNYSQITFSIGYTF